MFDAQNNTFFPLKERRNRPIDRIKLNAGSRVHDIRLYTWIHQDLSL